MAKATIKMKTKNRKSGFIQPLATCGCCGRDWMSEEEIRRDVVSTTVAVNEIGLWFNCLCDSTVLVMADASSSETAMVG